MSRSKSPILGLAAAALILGWGFAAQAEVEVFVDVDKDKNVEVNEEVDVFKEVDIDVDVMEQPDSAAEQGVYKNQDNNDNVIDVSGAEAAALIDNAVVSANGVVLINQAPGYANNQGNEVGMSYARGLVGEGEGDTFVHAQTSVEQDNFDNFVGDFDNLNTNTISTGAFIAHCVFM